ncbi:MAG: methyltransferase domain-containing protein [Streptosporangiaceae bacterium]|jgi:SAM-dependent methyltransferase
MVGDQGGGGGGPDPLTAGVTDPLTGLVTDPLTADVRMAYESAAAGWADGPALVYAPLARALVASAGVLLAGSRVLDLGAGTGAAGLAARASGARQVVAVDLAVGMLRRCPAPLRPLAADAAALPFRDGSFDLVVAAFCLSHLASIGAGLAEARRVGRAIAASAFTPGWTHPAKAAVDDALRPFGYRPPAWHGAVKSQGESQAGDPALLTERAAAAGFRDVQVRTIVVATGLSTAAQLASWRLGMANIAAFVRSLDAPHRAAARYAAERAVVGCEPPVVPMVVLTGS